MFHIDYKLDKDSHNGIGLFVTQNVLEGDIVVDYDEEWVRVIYLETLEQMSSITRKSILKHAYDGAAHAKYGLPEGYIYFDLDDCRFLNHSDNPSIAFDYEDEKYKATRDLIIGDELTMDYREFCTVGKYCADFLSD
jgi:hypothetical protein